jgi:glycogen phosphorylase
LRRTPRLEEDGFVMPTQTTTGCVDNERESSRVGLSKKTLKRAVLDHLFFTQGRIPEIATTNDLYLAVAFAVRDRLLGRWVDTIRHYHRINELKVAAYLSAEFLVGPHLANNLVNLGGYDEMAGALSDLGWDMQLILDHEPEPGLGNGGLGRLAACFLDSLSTLEVPAIGYGIRYEFGIFRQELHNGEQVELTDKWLGLGNPWEIMRPEISYDVKLGGRTEDRFDATGKYRGRWIPERVIRGVAYDTPIPGYKVNTCNTLRLWKAEAVDSFDFQAFNVGDYYGAVDAKVFSETITKVLYPNDEPELGKHLRLAQQYFFVSCSLQDMLRMHFLFGGDLTNFSSVWAVQLNDTHPAIAIVELMRLLVDEMQVEWDEAWRITTKACSYTNHTLLPEALEKWPLQMFAEILPRHLEIIYEINQRFLAEVRAARPYEEDLVSRVSLIDEEGERYVRMAHLAGVGSHHVNGVAEIHSQLLKLGVLKDFYELNPEKFTNITNGVTPRRFLLVSNPGLAQLITDGIGDKWVTDLGELRKIEAFVDDGEFRREWRKTKLQNKERLAALILKRTGIRVDPASMFDVHVKRIHEYKRQHLNLLHIIELYRRIKENPSEEITPRTFIFAGKAAPGYFMAKLIIKCINSVAEVVNGDPDVRDRLKVVFIPNLDVKTAERIYPAADLSQQISTAGKEASGTGNMKFALNGAVTIGTLDGANLEIREAVGKENFLLFGLTAEEVIHMRAHGYNPRFYYESNPHIRGTLDLISSGAFSVGDSGLFRPIVDSLLFHDEYMLLADYQSYADSRKRGAKAFGDPERWTTKCIFNVARIGHFSSDRAIREYCRKIWKTASAPVIVHSPRSAGEAQED